MLKNLLNRFLAAPAAPAPAPAPTPAPAPAPAPEDIARADALVAQGNDLEDAGDVVQAEAMYREAVAAAPSHPRAHLNLGVALAEKGDQEGAIAAYEQVLAIDPSHPFGNYNYGRLAFLRGDLAKAETLLAEALRAKPEFPQALVVRSDVLDALGKPAAAIEALQAALRLQPADAGAWFNLALMLQKSRRPDDAEAALERALEGEPDNPAALELQMRVLRDQGFAAEALVPLRKVIERDATSWAHRSFELMLMSFVDGVAASTQFRRHLEFGNDLERAVPVRFDSGADHGNPKRRLRVGYLSADYVLHAVTIFLAPVLECHDRSQVEVFCYSFGSKQDSMTERVRASADHWRDVASLSDDELADAIHADGIDVLVDLMGHTGQPRLGVFCQRPAPVQVGWLGYLNTTGLTRMDYRITDVRSDPPALSQPFHTERLVPMPASQWCYRALVSQDIDPDAPFERNGHLTFGSFNSALKVTPAACRLWAQTMLRVPGSRLVIGDVSSEHKRAAILRDIARFGVAEERVAFVPRVPFDEYLGLYNLVDITFDTFPYGGGTTTFDSLWMGVPVLATIGETPVSRSAASILTALGLEDWIAPSVDDFVDVAVARASDRAVLRALRTALRPRMQGSLLTDLPRYTRDLEAAYRRMWLEKTNPSPHESEIR